MAAGFSSTTASVAHALVVMCGRACAGEAVCVTRRFCGNSAAGVVAGTGFAANAADVAFSCPAEVGSANCEATVGSPDGAAATGVATGLISTGTDVASAPVAVWDCACAGCVIDATAACCGRSTAGTDAGKGSAAGANVSGGVTAGNGCAGALATGITLTGANVETFSAGAVSTGAADDMLAPGDTAGATAVGIVDVVVAAGDNACATTPFVVGDGACAGDNVDIAASASGNATAGVVVGPIFVAGAAHTSSSDPMEAASVDGEITVGNADDATAPGDTSGATIDTSVSGAASSDVAIDEGISVAVVACGDGAGVLAAGFVMTCTAVVGAQVVVNDCTCV
eukprot:TRINITY_DN11777_c0_g1_i11.p1 TRINITY_DN11777_c0_g1~~TRINITY_DN11777_c0_g1_i11.p1  ORF type:complete len:381 (+),score=77.35 TRINITY_DN11777_c0_g1_i11:126-1145(+)